jgi:hypothetical protein
MSAVGLIAAVLEPRQTTWEENLPAAKPPQFLPQE